jgi:hypothetical protein
MGGRQVSGAVEFLRQPQRESGRFADVVDGRVGALLGGGAGAMM